LQKNKSIIKYIMKYLFFILFLIASFSISAQETHPSIGCTAGNESVNVEIRLIAKIQNYTTKADNTYNIRETDIYSPKSIIFLEEKQKFYVNSLEGYKTIVFDINTFKKKKTIVHSFGYNDSHLFLETNVLGYHFLEPRSNPNVFKGKPVESCLSHNGKYLWVTYYRRSYDPNAIEPSALAIIDTDKDEIVRVMPTGPLPKMIACSPDNKHIAVTHWGDNTVGIIDISSDNVEDFKYVKHLVVGYQASFTKKDNEEHINRDNNCGYCLRGTAFTTDSKYLLVGRMGGGGGIAVFDMNDFSTITTVWGMKTNVRHLVVTDKFLYLSSNRTGYVQKTPIDGFINFAINPENKNIKYTNWSNCYAGIGARTIEVSEDEEYIFVAVNNESKIVIIRAKDMKRIAVIKADSYPVGLAYSEKRNLLISTSQGRKDQGGGNCVDVFSINFFNNVE